MISLIRLITLALVAALTPTLSFASNPPPDPDCSDSEYAEANPCECKNPPDCEDNCDNEGGGSGGGGSSGGSSGSGGGGGGFDQRFPEGGTGSGGGGRQVIGDTGGGSTRTPGGGFDEKPGGTLGSSGSNSFDVVTSCNGGVCEKRLANRSLGFRLPFGGLPFESSLGQGTIIIHQHTPSPSQFTPQVARYASVLAMRISSASTPAGAAWTIGVFNDSGLISNFQLPVGADTAFTSRNQYGLSLLTAAREPFVAGGSTLPAYARFLYRSGAAGPSLIGPPGVLSATNHPPAALSTSKPCPRRSLPG